MKDLTGREELHKKLTYFSNSEVVSSSLQFVKLRIVRYFYNEELII